MVFALGPLTGTNIRWIRGVLAGIFVMRSTTSVVRPPKNTSTTESRCYLFCYGVTRAVFFYRVPKKFHAMPRVGYMKNECTFYTDYSLISRFFKRNVFIDFMKCFY